MLYLLAGRFACKANKLRYKTMQKVNTQKAVTAGIANLNSGAIYTLPASGLANGESVAKFAADNSSDKLSQIAVTLSPFGKGLIKGLPIPSSGLSGNAAIIAYMQAFKNLNNGMFAVGTTVRCYQFLCYMLGVVPNSSKNNKSYKWENLLAAKALGTLGGSNASLNLGHISQVVKHTGGKAPTVSNIADGNTLCMLLSGTNTAKSPQHAFFKKPIVQLVVKPTVK